jgi:predicted dehydrogenase
VASSELCADGHYTFRWFYDYSGGKITDWGAHHLDIAQWGIGSDSSGPVEVEGTARFPTAGLFDTAVSFDIHYRYANGVTLHCTSQGDNGVTFEGTDGKIFVSRERIEADPQEILETEPGTGSVRLSESHDHKGNWVDCMRNRERPICDVEIGHRSATICHISNIAIKLGRKLGWNPDAERFEADEEANRFVRRPMRKPWSL